MSNRSNIDKPGNGYKRNFNKNPRGKFQIKMKRGSTSRAKSARG
jgi:hypothetical protein